MKKCGILVWLWKYDLYDYEKISFRRLYDLYSSNENYLFIYIMPNGFDLDKFINQNIEPNKIIQDLSYDWIYLDEKYFKSSATYNIVCLDPYIYKTYKDTIEYIFICQFDAYIFNDQLEYWLNKKYDFIGGYGRPINIYDYEKIQKSLPEHKILIDTNNLKYKPLMNGGFSLRNTKYCLDIINKYWPDLYYSLEDSYGCIIGEDTFFSLHINYNIPIIESIKFAYNSIIFEFEYPINNYEYPFGVHGINKSRYLKDLINQFNKENNLDYGIIL